MELKGPSLVWLRNSCVNVHLLGLHMKFLGQIGRNVLILVYQKVTILTVSTFFECTLMCLLVLFSDMSMSTLVNILAQKSLTGSNFSEWKRHLDFILVAEEHKCNAPPFQGSVRYFNK